MIIFWFFLNVLMAAINLGLYGDHEVNVIVGTINACVAAFLGLYLWSRP